MKKHFAKLLTERERILSGNRHSDIKGLKKRYQKDRLNWLSEEHIRKEGINPARGMGGLQRKELNENLGPLYRFLNSKVGCLWNDVYSEIRENIDTKSAVQMHIMSHLYDMIEKDAIELDGKMVVFRGRRMSWENPAELSADQLYIDSNGIIAKYVEKKTKIKKAVLFIVENKEEKTIVYFSCNGSYYKTWWKLPTKLEELETDRKNIPKEIRTASLHLMGLDWRAKTYCYRKQQITTKEATKLK